MRIKNRKPGAGDIDSGAGFHFARLGFDVDLEWLAHCALDVAAFKAACPTQDERAPFVGVGHDLSPFEGCHYLPCWTNRNHVCSIASCLGKALLAYFLSACKKRVGDFFGWLASHRALTDYAANVIGQGFISSFNSICISNFGSPSRSRIESAKRSACHSESSPFVGRSSEK